MNTTHWTDALRQLGIYSECVEWAAHFPTLELAWRACDRGDWMLWLCGDFAGTPWSDARRRLVLCTCECARTVLHLVPAQEDRPRIAIECAEAWARGESDECLALRGMAAATEDYAMYAPNVASHASIAADNATICAFACLAANFAVTVANASADAAMLAARRDILKTCSEIVRRHYPVAPTLKELSMFHVKQVG